MLGRVIAWYPGEVVYKTDKGALRPEVPGEESKIG
jgi:hypothetical protein